MMKKQPSNLDKKTVIYNCILEHPCLHFRELARKLQMPQATLSYHLRCLEKNGLIISKKEGRHNRYYVADDVNNIEREILNVLRQDTLRDVLRYISLTMSASQIELAKELEKDPKTIEVHLKKLLDLDIIEVAPVDKAKGIIYTAVKTTIINRKPCKNEIFYRIKYPQKIRLYEMSLKYYNKKTINDPVTEACVSYTKFVSPGRGAPRIAKTSKQVVETLEKIIYEIFPHPYHV